MTNQSTQPITFDPMDLIQVVEPAKPIAFRYQNTVVIRDGDPFEMAGVTVQPVRAAEPIFFTDGRYPGRPTVYGWVPAYELHPITSAPGYEDALENWQEAIRDVDRLIDEGFPRSEIAAASQHEIECAQLFCLVAGVR